MLVKSSRWEEKQKHGLCGETMMKHIFFFLHWGGSWCHSNTQIEILLFCFFTWVSEALIRADLYAVLINAMCVVHIAIPWNWSVINISCCHIKFGWRHNGINFHRQYEVLVRGYRGQCWSGSIPSGGRKTEEKQINFWISAQRATVQHNLGRPAPRGTLYFPLWLVRWECFFFFFFFSFSLEPPSAALIPSISSSLSPSRSSFFSLPALGCPAVLP